MKCIRGYDVVPVESMAGYYRGTRDEEGFPNCRLSSQYAGSKEEAEKLPLDRQYAIENNFCNGCGSCFK